MEKSLIIIAFLYFPLSLNAQIKPDSVDHWGYTLDKTYTGYSTDSVKAIGEITFARIVGIKSKAHRNIYGNDWFPRMSFAIYLIKDQDFVDRYAMRIKASTSCAYAAAGGDVIVVGDLILFNKSHCLDCADENFKDFCRPMIRYILSKADPLKVHSIVDLVDQLLVQNTTAK